MGRSSSSEPVKTTKRKGTRSVSTLTPSQLARKRANDREAQRAIRARTKEHIERLERELEELKCQQNRDHTVRELLRKNKALEDELFRLRQSMGISPTQSYPNSAYEDNLSSISGAVSSPRSSPFPAHGGDYNAMQELAPSYVPLPDTTDAWGHGFPVSNVSSPSSSANTDEYTNGYIPTSVPATSMIDSRPIPAPAGVPAMHAKEIEMDPYEDVDSDTGYPLAGPTPHHPGPPSHHPPPLPMQASFLHQQPWTMYPGYYQQQPSAH